jgi:hypothetical protein
LSDARADLGQEFLGQFLELHDPIDLYMRHISPPINAMFRRLLPLLEPTRADPILPNFENYRELWG